MLQAACLPGLCLYPDRYSYNWNGVRLDPIAGASDVLLECTVSGEAPLPIRMPEIAWRAGLDLNPIDLTDPDAANWLETLIWPEQHERRARIRAAMDIVRSDPPRVVAGDATDGLAALASEAPKDATLVIQNSAAIVYLTPENRARYIELVTGLVTNAGAHWMSNEGPGIVPGALAEVPEHAATDRSRFLLALDGHPLAWTGPHGQWLDWFASPREL